MGLWAALTGRMRPVPANLDSLFAVPGAAITLETAAGMKATGVGSVCYRPAAGAGFSATQEEIVALLDHDPNTPDVSVSTDRFGFSWLVVQRDPADLGGLCTDLHAVNTILGEQGYGGGLLCTLVAFRSAEDRPVGLVYLYKQGTFYPFVPLPGDRRDTPPELTIRDLLAGELPVEKDTQRWLAVWGAPGLD